MIKTVGILGAGQLARMLAQAGQSMGLDFIFLDPAKDACAAEFGTHICAGWDDEAALKKLALASDVVRFDFYFFFWTGFTGLMRFFSPAARYP